MKDGLEDAADILTKLARDVLDLRKLDLPDAAHGLFTIARRLDDLSEQLFDSGVLVLTSAALRRSDGLNELPI